MLAPLLILPAYAITLLLTVAVRNLLLKRSILDLPNERSSHKTPVPRGGGWAVVLVLIPGMIIAGVKQHSFLPHAGIIAGTVLLALISWLDDRKGGVGIGLRLSMHILAACIGSMAFTSHQTIFAGHLPFWLDRTLMIIGWAWFINLYNFMDGIDGITGVESISIAAGVCLIMTVTGIGDPFASTLTMLVLGSCLGFLALNWHPAKIFLGDIGSVPLGYLTGFLLLNLAVNGHWAPALIIPAYYLADSGITITRRALRGEKFWQAHRQHFYQKAAQGTGRHDRVVVLIILANIGLIASSFGSETNILAGISFATLITGLLLWKMNRLA